MSSLNRFHVMKDPVHGTMQFNSCENAWTKPFIDSPLFQRLRHIRQMGMGDFIFPGAVHTRFSHSLGCCYVANQIATKIGLPDAEKQLVMIAGLLHDVGHGPFSHAFEGLFKEEKIRHEEWTPYFLQDYASDAFFENYNQRNIKFPLHEDNFNVISRMIKHEGGTKPLLADIVSSQLDADRLDYLLRDNYFCGVTYGLYDLRWMLHCLTRVQTEMGERLGITHKGIGVLEQYLMARRLMTRSVYQAHKKLALESYLVHWLNLLANALSEDDLFLAIKHTALGKFLMASYEFKRHFQVADQADRKSIKHEFLSSHQNLYKKLCDYDVFSNLDLAAHSGYRHSVVTLAHYLQNRITPKIIRLDHLELSTLESEYQTFRGELVGIDDWQLELITAKHISYSAKDPVYILNEDGEVVRSEYFSTIINSICDQPEPERVTFLSVDEAIADDPKIKTFIRHIQGK